MVSIHGVGGIPEPKPERTDKVRDGRGPDTARADAAKAGATGADGVTISSEAQNAAEAARIARLAQTQDDVRADRVEAARESIARGDYKDPEVVAEVAQRLLKYLA